VYHQTLKKYDVRESNIEINLMDCTTFGIGAKPECGSVDNSTMEIINDLFSQGADRGGVTCELLPILLTHFALNILEGGHYSKGSEEGG